jgi:diguanylate cyclase (GGDEF)-like protein
MTDSIASLRKFLDVSGTNQGNMICANNNAQEIDEDPRDIELREMREHIEKLEEQNRALRDANRSLLRDLSATVMQANTDHLTGLFNYKGLYHMLDDNRLGSGMHGILMINDTYGHEAGDKALCVVAEALKDQVRSTDIISRKGGDEFVVILRDTDLDTLHSKKISIDQMFETLTFDWNGATQNIRGSVGHCMMDMTQSPQDNLHVADIAMYLEKNRQRGTATLTFTK